MLTELKMILAKYLLRPGLVLVLFTAIGLLHAEEICAAREPSRSCPGLQKYVVGGLASCGERAPWNGKYYKLFEWMQSSLTF